MAKRVASSVGNINDFPDEILTHIISFLPFKRAVRTSILSRRWRYLFTFLSKLDLEFDIFEYKEDDEEEHKKRFTDFVDKLLFYREVPSIIRFRLKSYELIDFQKVGLWVFALVWNKIQELDLWIDVIEWADFSDYPLPPNLFLCESLVVLKLDMCWDSSRYKFPSRICLPSLKVLHWKTTVFPDDGSEERLFSGCPVLEDLLLGGYFKEECTNFNFSISNQSLKTLTLKNIISYGEVVRFVINAPSLVLLNCYISEDYTIELKGVKSLPKAVIDGHPLALREIQSVKTLEINYNLLKDLQRDGLPIPLFDKMICLKLKQCWQFNPICLEYFLARCVVLKTLILKDFSSHSTNQDTSNQYSLQKSQLAPLLCHLKTIKIYLYDIAEAKTLMRVIAFFLQNARVLEKLEIHSKKGLPEQQVEIMKEITSFPRGSTKCKVLF